MLKAFRVNVFGGGRRWGCVASNPLRDWGTTFLLLGGIVAVVAFALVLAQLAVSGVSERNYAFASQAPGAFAFAALLVVLGALLRRLAALRVPRDVP